MKHTNAATNGALRYLYEALFSATIASAFLTGLISSSEIYWSAQFFGWEMGFNHTFKRGYRDYLGQTLAFCVFCLVLTVAGFILLRALSRATLTTKVLRTISGVIAMAAPLACLWSLDLNVGNCLSSGAWNWTWLRFEGCAGVGCAVLYACNRWPVSVPTTAILLTVHGALWFGGYSEMFAVCGYCWRSVPIIAYFSTMLWGYYVMRFRQRQSAPHELPRATIAER